MPGLTSTRVTLAIGEREAQSPWISITDKGTPVIHTVQARLYVRSRVAPTALAGLSGLISVDLPIFVELAGAEGRLDAINCASETTRGVTLEARTDAVRAAIGNVDETRMSDFTRAAHAHAREAGRYAAGRCDRQQQHFGPARPSRGRRN
ncbi:MAG: hypothetical protein P0Y64_10105 [Candidatus Sphingomonas colombiensis]|nr:hypothetical protein [Sphingomonas sp.]WEK41767.1 MAG: hypothetical protein P0Y64_10105 [Sphingomonas sp.]